VSPEPPGPEEKLRALREFTAEGTNAWPEIPDDDPEPGFIRRHVVVIAMVCALFVALGYLGWIFGSQFARISRDLDEAKVKLAAANDEIARLKRSFEEASVIHGLWGLGSEFATAGSSLCTSGDDKQRLGRMTSATIEMWSDSVVRSEVDLEGSLLPVLRGLKEHNFRVIGASLPPGMVAQYRRFHREGVGDVVMMDPSRITDSAARVAVLDLLRRAGDGQLDPEKTHILYRFDKYGKVSYPMLQGEADASLVQAALSDDPLATPVTVTVADYPCS
jgi:hypothetical protein